MFQQARRLSIPDKNTQPRSFIKGANHVAAARKKASAISVLQQAEMCLLNEAYWDFGWTNKDRYLKMSYNRIIRRVSFNSFGVVKLDSKNYFQN